MPSIQDTTSCIQCSSSYFLDAKKVPVDESLSNNKNREICKSIGSFGVSEMLVPYLGSFKGKAY